MKTLIVYATNSGGTQIVAEMIGQVLSQAGQTVAVKRASEPDAAELAGYDLVVLGSCTWERFEGNKHLDGQLQEHMYALVQQLTGRKLPGQAFAVFGLGDSGFSHFCAATEHLEKFVDDLGGRLVGPTLQIDSFFFNPDVNRQRVRDWATSLAALKLADPTAAVPIYQAARQAP